MPNYYYDYLEDGSLWIGRGQFLLMVDCRSNYALSFALHTDRNYNGRIIRPLITRTHDDYGLPREGFYFEKGIWKKARILTGAKGDDMSIEETEKGLREWVKFRHAELPRGKVVEGILGIVQNLMEPLPGYIGRDERHDCYERMQKEIARIRGGKIQPWEVLYSRDQWVEELVKILEVYNNTPQEGRLKGLTPRQAYESYFTDPLHELSGDFRYLLANHRRVELVRPNGIRIQHGKLVSWYSNAKTGALVGQKVLTWFDPATPEFISVTDLERQNPFVVERVPELPATTATPEQMEQAKARIKAQNSYALTLYRVVKPHFTREVIRRTVGPVETAELGRAFEAGAEEIKSKQREDATKERRIQSVSKRLGNFTPSEAALQRQGTVQSLERLADFINEPETETQKGDQ